MKINLENMKGLAEKLDNDDARFPLTLTPDDMCRMAYQLQYFFEAIERLKVFPGKSWADADTVYRIIDLFDNEIIDKEE